MGLRPGGEDPASVTPRQNFDPEPRTQVRYEALIVM